MFKSLIKFFLVFLIFSSIAATASAQNREIVEIIELMQSGQYDAARQKLASNSRNPIDFVLLDAEIAVRQGDLKKAIALYRQVLNVVPQHVGARRRIAELLYEDKQYFRANFHLDQLKTIDPKSAPVYRAVQNRISKDQPYGISFGLSVTPSTNINNANESGSRRFLFWEFENPEELQPQFGWRKQLSVSAFARTEEKSWGQFILRGSARTTRYTVETLDSDEVTIDLILRKSFDRGWIQFGPRFERYWGDGEYYTTNIRGSETTAEISTRDEDFSKFGLALSARYIVNPKSAINISLYKGHTIHDDQDSLGSRDGWDHRMSVGFDHMISPQHQLQIQTGYAVHAEKGAMGDYDNQNGFKAPSVGIGLTSQWKSGFVTRFGVNYLDRKYDGNYIFTDKRRHDNVMALSVSVQNNNWQILGVSPRLDCSASRTYSNIPDVRSQGFSCGVALSHSF